VLDIFISFVCSCYNSSSALIVASPFEYITAYRSMLCHRSQLVWFRYLMILFSRLVDCRQFAHSFASARRRQSDLSASSSNWSQTIYIFSVISKLRYVMKSHVQFYSNKQVTATAALRFSSQAATSTYLEALKCRQ